MCIKYYPKKSAEMRIKWDQYETALLIETFWKIEEAHEKKSELIEKLSHTLRK